MILDSRRLPIRNTGLCLAVFVIGLALTLRYGARDYATADDDITWGMTERMMQGLVPHVDFYSFTNLVPAIFQIPFFSALGFTHYSMVLHAAVMNGLAGILAFGLLRRLGLGSGLACFYSICTTFVFYTPIGTPYPQAHSYFFAFAVIYVQLVALEKREVQAWLYFGAGLLAMLGFLSRPSPIGFFLPLSLLLFLRLPSQRMLPAAMASVLGLCVLPVLILVIVSSAGGSWRHVFEYEVLYPLRVGSSRTIFSPFILFSGYAFQMATVVTAYAAAAVAMAALARRAVTAPLAALWHETSTTALLVGGWSIVVMVFFQNSAQQPAWLGVQPLFIALGCLHIAVVGAVLRPGETGTASAAIVTVSALFVVMAAIDVSRFQITANALRGYPTYPNRILAEVPNAAHGLPAYAGLSFYTKSGDAGSPGQDEADIRRVFDLYRNAVSVAVSTKGGVVFCTMPVSLYNMAGKISPIPAVIARPGYSTPAPGTPDFGRLVGLTRRNLEQQSVATVIVPHNILTADLRAQLSSVQTEQRADFTVAHYSGPADERLLQFALACNGLSKPSEI